MYLRTRGAGEKGENVEEREMRNMKGGLDGENIFFFKQKTAYEIVDCDWSSDVCSSDLKPHRCTPWTRSSSVPSSRSA